MLINGPARCFSSWKTFKPGTSEFMIHNLVDGEPICGFKSQYKFTEMTIPIEELADWKKCAGCFKPE